MTRTQTPATRALVVLAVLLSGLLAGCRAAQPAAQPLSGTFPAFPTVLTVMTHDSFSVSASVLAEFERINNAKVQFVKAGDAGTMLNKAILSKDKPLADVLFGVDNTFLSRALKEGIFDPYDAPALADVPDDVQLDPENRALPMDTGDVCLNYDKAYFADRGINPPASLGDLTSPEFKGLLVIENPSTSSVGLAFLLATVGAFGDPGYLSFWEQLAANDVLVVDGWETAYNTEFSGSSGRGPRPIVVSYGSSPVFEVVYAATQPQEPPTAAVVSDNTCFRQIEFAGILRGTANRPLAEAWIDFMLSPIFQEDMPLQMYVFPVNPRAKLDPAFQEYLVVPDRPVAVAPADIEANRETWINAWREVVLR
jgi:thiamine transport system substrate-binding protein